MKNSEQTTRKKVLRMDELMSEIPAQMVFTPLHDIDPDSVRVTEQDGAYVVSYDLKPRGLAGFYARFKR